MSAVRLPQDWQILSSQPMLSMVAAAKTMPPGIRPQFIVGETGKPRIAELHVHRTHLPLVPELLEEQHLGDWSDISATPAQLEWLRPYQREDANFITRRAGTIVALDLGLGKTAIASASASEAYTVIVCPSSAIVVWEQECQRMDWSYAVLDHKEFRSQLRDGAFNQLQALIISYNLLPALAGSMVSGSKWRTHTLIADEAHWLTNKGVTWAQMFRMIARERTILMTATPMRNRLRSLWGLLDCACPNAFGKEYEFRKYYCGARQGEFALEDGEPTNQNELAKRLSECVIKRTRAQVELALPNHIRTTLECTIQSEELWAALQTVHGQKRDAHSAEQLRALGALRLAVGRAKARAMLKDLPHYVEEHRRVILWVWHREVAEILQKENNLGIPVDTLLGNTHSRWRTKTTDEWRAGDPSQARVLIASIGAASTAIALTTAKLAVFVELDWTPMNLIQAEKRHYRFGNVFKDIETAYIVSQVGIDRHMIGALLEKASASETTLGVDGSMDQMRELLSEAHPTSESIALRWLREGNLL
jgi:SNF2 family DNA or RNA helicase